MKKVVFIFFVGWISMVQLWAQNPFIKNYTVTDGLPTNKIYCVFKDTKGFIWFGTDDGVLKFDGSNFRQYDVEDGLSDMLVVRIKEDLEGRIWFLNLNGTVNYYQNNRIYNGENAPFLDEMKTNFFFHDFFQDKDSILYFYNSNSEIIVIDGDQYIDYFNFHRMHKNELDDFFYVNKNSKNEFVLWFPNNIYSFKEIDDSLKRKPNASFLRRAFPDKNNWSFVITNLGEIQHCFNDSVVTSIQPKSPTLMVNNVLIDSGGYFWISTFDKGLFCYKNDSLLLHIDVVRGQNLIQDKENNIWAVSNENGIYKINRDILKYKFIGNENFGGQEIIKIENAVNGGFWCSTGKMIYYSNNNMFFPLDFQFENEAISNIIQPDENTLVVNGFNSFIYKFNNLRFDKNKGKFVFSDFERSNYRAKEIVYHSENKVINTRLNDEILKISIDHIKVFNRVPLEHGRIINLFINNKNQLIVNASINMMIENDVVHYNNNYDYFNGKFITNNLTIDNTNELIVTAGNELHLIYNNKIYILTKNIQVPFDYRLNNLIFDGKTIYLSTNKSIYYLHSDFAPVGNKPIEIHKFNLEFNKINDIIYDNKILYIASNNGLTLIPTQEFIVDQSDPPISYINQVVIDEQVVDFYNKNVQFKSNKRLSIEFASLNFSSTPSEFSYQLEGVDQNWNLGKENRVVYLNLPPGTYNFKLKARKNFDNFGETIFLPIIVNPTFFQRLSVRIFILVLFIGTVFLLFRLSYVRKVRQKETENLLITLEHKALQSMMNPHFIFNALGSIQRYLLENKSTEAGLYLSRFARLIRQNMNSLKTNSINIEEEVERLRNYIELENFRMNNKFEYLIEVDANLDDFDISIPSMIVQPFVENAIWHGISSIDYQGEIRIFFKSIDDNSIQIIVEDNGVGMAYSESFKNNSKGLKMGIGITEKRLQLIGERENVKTMITTSEVFPSTNFPGTRVTIIAPILGGLS